MAVVANLDVILQARVDQFVQGLNGANVSTAEFRRQLRDAGITQREWNSILRQTDAVVASTVTQQEQLRRSIQLLSAVQATGVRDAEALQQAERALLTQLFALNPEVQAAAAAEEQLAAVRDRAAARLQAGDATRQQFLLTLRNLREEVAAEGLTQAEADVFRRQAVATFQRLSGIVSQTTVEEERAEVVRQRSIRTLQGLITPAQAYERRLAEINEELAEYRIDEAEAAAAREQAARELRRQTGELTAAERAQAEYNEELKEGNRVLRSLEPSSDRYERELRQLTVAARAAGLSQDQLNQRIAALDARFASAGTSARRSSALIGNFGVILRSTAQVAAIFATIEFGRGLIENSIEVENAIQRSSAIIRGVTDQTRSQLLSAALEVPRESVFSAREASEAFFFLFSAGLDVEQSLAALPRVARFAQAGNFDLARATDLATDAQSALGLTVDDASQNLENLTRVTNSLVFANTAANATTEQFSEALTNRAGPILRALNVDVEEGVAVLAAFADQGIKGQEAGTQLAIVLRELTRRAIINRDAFQEAGLSVFNFDGSLRSVADILQDFESQLDGLSVFERRTFLLDLGFTDRSVNSLQALLGTSENIRTLEREGRQANRSLTAFNVTLAEQAQLLRSLGDDSDTVARLRSIASALGGSVDSGSSVSQILTELRFAFEDLTVDRRIQLLEDIGLDEEGLALLNRFVGAFNATNDIVNEVANNQLTNLGRALRDLRAEYDALTASGSDTNNALGVGADVLTDIIRRARLSAREIGQAFSGANSDFDASVLTLRDFARAFIDGSVEAGPNGGGLEPDDPLNGTFVSLQRNAEQTEVLTQRQRDLEAQARRTGEAARATAASFENWRLSLSQVSVSTADLIGLDIEGLGSRFAEAFNSTTLADFNDAFFGGNLPLPTLPPAVFDELGARAEELRQEFQSAADPLQNFTDLLSEIRRLGRLRIFNAEELQAIQSVIESRRDDALRNTPEGRLAQQLIESTRTPLERFNEAVDRINALTLGSGIGEITAEVRRRAIAAEQERLRQAQLQDNRASRQNERSGPQTTGSAEQGSVEALRIIFNRTNGPLEDLVRIAQRRERNDTRRDRAIDNLGNAVDENTAQLATNQGGNVEFDINVINWV